MATYEALAPLGRLESLSDILAAGADAVYAGLYGFSSRPSDADLSLEQLESARELTAKRGVKLYVAVNSFIGHTQMDALLRQLEIVEQLGADAVILGDWGVLQAARSALKTTRLHASTLLGVYNSETVSILKGLGVDRIVLSTALYIEEIHSLLRQAPDIEYEIIASGGICRNDNRQCELPHDGKSLDYTRTSYPKGSFALTIPKNGGSSASAIFRRIMTASLNRIKVDLPFSSKGR